MDRPINILMIAFSLGMGLYSYFQLDASSNPYEALFLTLVLAFCCVIGFSNTLGFLVSFKK